MVKSKTVEVMVGFLFIAAMASFFMLALKVSGLSNLIEPETGYTIRAEFNNIGGLKVRSKVAMAGVGIGRVKDIKFDPKTYNALVEFEINHGIQLPKDTQASILTAGLLGDNYIGLTPGFEKNVLAEGETIAIENTESAVVLEQLISKFVATSANTPKH